MDHTVNSALRELFSDSQGFEELCSGIAHAVELSFWGDLEFDRKTAEGMIQMKMEPPVNYKTTNEVKRRLRICMDWAERLRRDLKWSRMRIVDTMPLALRKSLDGLPWEPKEHRDSWTDPKTI
jgi:hypothetical protein